jgi:hypothetical protein
VAQNGLAKPNVANISRAERRAIQALAWPDIWAEDLKLAVDSHPFDVRGREYEVEILRDESKNIVVPKGAQLGLTVIFILKSCHVVIKRKWKVLYLLPLKAGSVSFVQSRIDPLIDSNKSLKAEFSRTDNRAQKQTREGVNWYIRGTNIHSELREVPADILVLDERDVANEENLDDARARLDGSSVQRTYELSTPTVDGYGVYAEDAWYASDKMRWWVPCPGCKSFQVLTFEENCLPFLGDTIQESQTACRCSHCKRVLSDSDRAEMNAYGKWVPENPGAYTRGYHLNQFNSPTKTLADPKLGILTNFFAGQKDARRLKAFHQLALGLPYAAPGDKFTVEMMDRCRGDFRLGGIPDGPLHIGVDVGHDSLHVLLYAQTRYGQRRLWRWEIITGDGTRKKWQVFDDEVLSKLTNWIAVVDAHPDKEEVESLSKKYNGRVFMGFEKDRPEQPVTADFAQVKYGEPTKVNIDRTMAFDQLIKTYLDGNTLLPADAREIGEFLPRLAYNGFYAQHLPMARVEMADASDRIVARWVNGNSANSGGKQADHWHHADMFALVASMQDQPLQVDEEVIDIFVASGTVMAVR